jgi:hypothetical protein
MTRIPNLARLIVRWSLDGEHSNPTRILLASVIEPLGGVKLGTAAWEYVSDQANVLKMAAGLLLLAEREGAAVDHVTISIDCPPLS